MPLTLYSTLFKDPPKDLCKTTEPFTLSVTIVVGKRRGNGETKTEFTPAFSNRPWITVASFTGLLTSMVTQ